MPTILRQYQEDIILSARGKMRAGIKSILIQSPTGSGKTLLTAQMLKNAAERQMRCWFVVHRRELVKQSTETFTQVGVNHGVIAPTFYEEPYKLVQIASVQTLANRAHRIKPPKLIVWDEAHHTASKSWAKIHGSFPEAYHIGLTATPERLDGTGLRKWFSDIIKGPSVEWLIQNKFLAPYKLYAPPTHIVTSDLHKRMGDFAKGELAKAADKPRITGDAIKHYKKFASGKRAVVFCVSIEHSKHVANQFNEAGVTAVHVDGETDTRTRDEAIRRFRNGDTKVLTNVELFGEGFDLPALECAILLRPTQSLGLYLQQVGRALRPFPGKQYAVILDHAGNCERHGLPDQEREWSLDGRIGRGNRKTDGPSVRVCPKCFAAQFPGSLVCKHCGYEAPAKPREVEHADGDLEEVDLEALRIQRRREQSSTETFEDLVELGRKRGYKRPHLWAKHVHNARQANRLRRRII